MATITRNPSFADTGKDYARIQGRVTNADHNTAILHLQGRGPEGNRPYGFAVNVAVSSEVGEWLKYQAHPLPSIADSSQRYVPMQARYDADMGGVRFQVPGTVYNRAYGAAFVLSTFAPGLEPLVEWLKGNTGARPRTKTRTTSNPRGGNNRIVL